ncbi:MAG: hypothetical protein ACM3TR_06215 [Caulobacteraceae bacterium]
MLKRFNEIDVMRIIGFLMVVDQHILGAYAQRPKAGFADSMVLPYLFWSFASIVIFKKYSLLKDIVLVLVTGNASYHLWYMAMCIRIYIWFPAILAFISRIVKKNSLTQKLMFIFFFIAY